MKLAAKMHHDFVNSQPIAAQIYIYDKRPPALGRVGSDVFLRNLSIDGFLAKTTLDLFPRMQIELELPGFGIRRAHVVAVRYPFIECRFGDAAPRDNHTVDRWEGSVVSGNFPDRRGVATIEHEAASEIILDAASQEEVSNEIETKLSVRSRVGVIALLSALLWLPIIGALWMLFG